MWLWFLRSIEHFALFMDRLDQEVHWGFTNASSKIDPIVNHYSTKSSAEAVSRTVSYAGYYQIFSNFSLNRMPVSLS